MSTLAIGGSRLRPLPLFKTGTAGSNPVNLTLPFTAYSTFLTHGAVSGGASQKFDLTQIVTSSSGGAGITVALTPTTMQITVLAGTFLAGDVLTQQTGANTGANAVQAGASTVVGPFVVGEQLSSSSGGSGEIVEVNAGTIVITGPGGAPAVQGTFNDGDTLTQTTGAGAGATTVMTAPATTTGLLAAQTVSVTFDLSNYINGRVRGNVNSDVAGTLGILYGNDKATMDLSFVVPQDTSQPNFQYPFDIIVLQPFCRIVFTNGAAPSGFFRSFVSALPV